MKPSQTIYILRRLRATLATDGDEQAAQALEIAAQAVQREQDAERLQQSGRRKSMPVPRSKGAVVRGVPRLGGLVELITAQGARGG